MKALARTRTSGRRTSRTGRGQIIAMGGGGFSMEPDNPEYLGNLARVKVRRGDHDDQMKKLLEELVMKDSRPEWNHWARMNLFRLNRPTSDEPQPRAATMPATRS